MLSFNHCSHATESCSDKVYHCTDVHIFENTIKNMSALPRRGGFPRNCCCHTVFVDEITEKN